MFVERPDCSKTAAAALDAAAAGMDVPAMEEHVRLVTGADLETATAAQLRQAAQALRQKRDAAA